MNELKFSSDSSEKENGLKRLVGNKIFDSAVVVAFVTAFSYLIAYVYEATYMDYFGAGSESARVEPAPVVVTSFVIFASVVGCGGILYAISRSIDKETKFKRRNLKRLLFLLVFIGISFLPLIYSENPATFKRYIIRVLIRLFLVLGGLAAIEIGVIMLILRMKKARRKSTNQYKKNIKVNRATLSFDIVIVLNLIALCFIYAQTYAIATAYNQRQFKLIVKNGTNYLVIREYSTHLVAVNYDKKKNGIGNKFIYVPLGDSDMAYTVLSTKLNYTSQFITQSRQENPNSLLLGTK